MRDGLMTSLAARKEARSSAPDADAVDEDVVAASLKSWLCLVATQLDYEWGRE